MNRIKLAEMAICVAIGISRRNGKTIDNRSFGRNGKTIDNRSFGRNSNLESLAICHFRLLINDGFDFQLAVESAIKDVTVLTSYEAKCLSNYAYSIIDPKGIYLNNNKYQPRLKEVEKVTVAIIATIILTFSTLWMDAWVAPSVFTFCLFAIPYVYKYHSVDILQLKEFLKGPFIRLRNSYERSIAR